MTTENTPTNPETITVEFPGTAQTVIDILQDQFGSLDAGELRTQLTAITPEVWNDAEFTQLFETTNVHAPYIDVVRKQDGAVGTVLFVDSPRFYFSFTAGTAPNDNRTA